MKNKKYILASPNYVEVANGINFVEAICKKIRKASVLDWCFSDFADVREDPKLFRQAILNTFGSLGNAGQYQFVIFKVTKSKPKMIVSREIDNTENDISQDYLNKYDLEIKEDIACEEDITYDQ